MRRLKMMAVLSLGEEVDGAAEEDEGVVEEEEALVAPAANRPAAGGGGDEAAEGVHGVDDAEDGGVAAELGGGEVWAD
jgi:hypothetical protein